MSALIIMCVGMLALIAIAMGVNALQDGLPRWVALSLFALAVMNIAWIVNKIAQGAV
jgi:hypothetical protein